MNKPGRWWIRELRKELTRCRRTAEAVNPREHLKVLTDLKALRRQPFGLWFATPTICLANRWQLSTINSRTNHNRAHFQGHLRRLPTTRLKFANYFGVHAISRPSRAWDMWENPEDLEQALDIAHQIIRYRAAAATLGSRTRFAQYRIDQWRINHDESEIRAIAPLGR